ncbi:hybrid sensor histidine kinase/response regulator [Oceanicoccus sagamiensis]|uniref:histidine kinase n=1 Tax=Oceanicoccus sagamiensis TaxID=716816 RepID=A0A1X9N6V0_9GAMM|nr:hybrid sensor histidine kinase/response regulator [Oceanicoccus sagamiensis]ARN72961.1 hypothetical protein BST96_01870 [Oceanicoccus sagamiensis]
MPRLLKHASNNHTAAPSVGIGAALARLLSLPYLLLALIFSSPYSLANTASALSTNDYIKLEQQLHSLDLTTSLLWLEDRTHSLNINKVLQPGQRQYFQSNTAPVFNQGYTDSSIWFYLPLEQLGNFSDRHWVIEIGYPQLDLIDFYIRRPSGEIRHIKMGDSLPYAARDFASESYLIPINFGADKTLEIFFKVKTSSALQLPISINSAKYMMEKQSQHHTIYGVYFGIMGVMILYNLFIYFSFREVSYLYFISYVATLALMQASISGHAFTYLWPASTQWVNIATPFFISLASLLSLQFTRTFLPLKQFAYKLDQLIKNLCYLSMALAVASLILPTAMVVQLGVVLMLISCAITIYAGINSLSNHFQAARFFVAGWLFMLPGVFIHSLASINLMPSNFFTMYAGQIGALIEISLLSLALADRMNIQRKDNLESAETTQQQLEKINQELNQALDNLEQNNRLKDQFLGTMSHELRTPMNGVEGSLKLLSTDNLTDKQRNYLDTAKLSAKEMTSVIDSLLCFSEMQSGELACNREAFEFRTLLNPQALEFRHQCQQKNLDFNWHIDKSVPMIINGDSHQILLVLQQLIDNAIKFTQQGQIAVNISTGWDEQSQQQMLSFSVIDSGSGIPPEQLSTIFTPFQQGDGSASRSHSGLGIGLAICQQIAAMMGGRLKVDSAIGRGTEFTFTIPLSTDGECKAVAKTLNKEATSYLPKTILIAEDNPVNQMVLKGMLQSLNCLILTASNGEEVSKLLNEQPVDLIMMDCQMPVMDGFEATRKIRNSQAAYSNIPIIAVTANAMSGDSVRCINAGMNDYIKKPIKQDVVERKVKRWLQNSKLMAS